MKSIIWQREAQREGSSSLYKREGGLGSQGDPPRCLAGWRGSAFGRQLRGQVQGWAPARKWVEVAGKKIDKASVNQGQTRQRWDEFVNSLLTGWMALFLPLWNGDAPTGWVGVRVGTSYAKCQSHLCGRCPVKREPSPNTPTQTSISPTQASISPTQASINRPNCPLTLDFHLPHSCPT